MALRNSTLDRCDLIITGTGSLSCHVGLGLACGWGAPLRVAVLGRSDARVDALIRSLNCRAAALEQPLAFVGRTVDWGSDSQLRALLWTCRPRAVLHTASLQSPWSLARAGDPWSRLVMEVGFGLTLPLQSRLAIALAAAAKDAPTRLPESARADGPVSPNGLQTPPWLEFESKSAATPQLKPGRVERPPSPTVDAAGRPADSASDKASEEDRERRRRDLRWI